MTIFWLAKKIANANTYTIFFIYKEKKSSSSWASRSEKIQRKKDCKAEQKIWCFALESATPELFCTSNSYTSDTKYYSSASLDYEVLVQYFSNTATNFQLHHNKNECH